jgi:putative oxidoreductase
MRQFDNRLEIIGGFRRWYGPIFPVAIIEKLTIKGVFMNQSNQNLAALLGRNLLAAVFVLSGINKLGNFAGTAAFMSSAGLPLAELLLVTTIAIELVCGLMLVIGWQTRFAALVLLLFMIPVTAIFHNPWAATDAALAQQQMIHFLKNIAIMGGLLNVLAFGAGSYSVEARRMRWPQQI